MKIKAIIIVMLISTFLLAGCTKTGENEENISVATPVFEKISAQEAKELMEDLSSDDYIILDVRTIDEYNEGHIDGALLIPDYELEERAETELEDKSQIIFIYCRSGNRSAGAAKTLEELGYMNIYDFGGIIDWPYDIVTEP
jgi:rhodanese-related sulfurtransferase